MRRISLLVASLLVLVPSCTRHRATLTPVTGAFHALTPTTETAVVCAWAVGPSGVMSTRGYDVATTITGKVVDARSLKVVNGAIVRQSEPPVVGASVRYRRGGLRTTTDARGCFQLPLPVRRDTLVVTAVGFAPYALTGLTADDGSSSIQLELTTDAQIDEVPHPGTHPPDTTAQPVTKRTEREPGRDRRPDQRGPFEIA